MGENLALSIAGNLSELQRLAKAVDALLDRENVSREAADTVQLALDELVTNIILWGRDDGQDGRVEVQVAVEPSQVSVVIENDGPEFDPLAAPPPDVLLPPDRRPEGGLGIHLVRTMVDDMAYRREGGRNVVRFQVDSQPFLRCPPGTALLLVDVINAFSGSNADALLPYANSMAQQIATLKQRASQAGVPVVYLNENDGRWKPAFSRQVQDCSAADMRGSAVVKRLQPGPDDFFVLRKVSDCFPDALDRLLEKMHATTLVVAGLASSISLLVAANDTHLASAYRLIVPRDCIAAAGEANHRQALEQIRGLVGADTRPSCRVVFASHV